MGEWWVRDPRSGRHRNLRVLTCMPPLPSLSFCTAHYHHRHFFFSLPPPLVTLTLPIDDYQFHQSNSNPTAFHSPANLPNPIDRVRWPRDFTCVSEQDASQESPPSKSRGIATRHRRKSAFPTKRISSLASPRNAPHRNISPGTAIDQMSV